jgi:dihydrofolate reductase
MSSLVMSMTMSLDGYAAGPEVSVDNAMGVGGEALHKWLFDGDETDKAAGESLSAGIGACIVGRVMHDLGVPHWGDVPFPLPTVVLTHEELPDKPMASGTFTYVSGIKPALARARELAGDQDVLLMGGPGVIRQYLSVGLVDEIRLSIAYLLLGGGLRLFEGIGNPPPRFEAVSSTSSSLATHLVLRTVR